MGHLRLAERGDRDCFHEAAAPKPGGDDALRRYDDNGKGCIRGAGARGFRRDVEGGMGWCVSGERIGWSLRPYSHFVV